MYRELFTEVKAEKGATCEFPLDLVVNKDWHKLVCYTKHSSDEKPVIHKECDYIMVPSCGNLSDGEEQVEKNCKEIVLCAAYERNMVCYDYDAEGEYTDHLKDVLIDVMVDNSGQENVELQLLFDSTAHECCNRLYGCYWFLPKNKTQLVLAVDTNLLKINLVMPVWPNGDYGLVVLNPECLLLGAY